MNPYDVLQVSPVADALVIRAAYRSLIQRYHPDRNPGDPDAARRAVLVAQAYELLADVDRRAAYDRQAVAHRETQYDTIKPKPKQNSRPVRRQANSTTPTSSVRITWTLCAIALVILLALVWTVQSLGWVGPKSAAPAKQLADIRLQVESLQTSEAQRRELLVRKQALLDQNQSLLIADSTARADDMATRSLALLLEPISVSLAPPVGLDVASWQLLVPEITIVLGSFDAPKLKDHVLKQRSRIVQELTQKLSAQAAAIALTPDAQARLKRMIRESVMTSLDIKLGEEYPSTYFESPGRYGVVEVVLPQTFSVLR